MKEVLRAHWFFWPRKCWQNIDEYIAKNYNVYGSVYGIKTKHTCRFGESGIGRTSGGWKFPELTSLRSGGESNPGLTSLQVCLLWNQNLFVSKNMNGRVGGWKFSFSFTRHYSLFGYLSKWTPLSRWPLFCVFVVDIWLVSWSFIRFTPARGNIWTLDYWISPFCGCWQAYPVTMRL